MTAIADQLDNTKHYVLAFSGGKDSVAAWLYLTRELKLPRVTCTFADTGHEADETYAYIDMLAEKHGLPLVKIQPLLVDMAGQLDPVKVCERLGLSAEPKTLVTEPLTMERLAILKRRFPSTTVRFCTQLLKRFPQQRWLRQNCEPADTIYVTGIRAEESPSRAAMTEWMEDEAFHCPLWHPLHQWTAAQVFDLHAKHGVPPNPLYRRGCSRVGCYPCIMANKPELAAIARHDPACFDKLAAMERRVQQAIDGKNVMTFFANTKVPPKYRSVRAEASGQMCCTADDVRRWAVGEVEAGQGDMFANCDDEPEPPLACESLYGLCE